MNWKEEILQHERHTNPKKGWKRAIELLQHVIEEQPDDRDAYLRILYWLQRYIAEIAEQTPAGKSSYSAKLVRYFEAAYPRFSEDEDYLYFMGMIYYFQARYLKSEPVEAKNWLIRSMKDTPHYLFQLSLVYVLNTDPLHSYKDRQGLCVEVFELNRGYLDELAPEIHGQLGQDIREMLEGHYEEVRKLEGWRQKLKRRLRRK